MNRKQFIILGVVAAVVAILAVVIGNIQSGRHEATPQGQLYPSLEAQLNSVTKISVRKAGDIPVTIVWENDRWTVAEKAGYPADVGRLRQTLMSLANAKLVEAKTRNPDHYPKLGVQDIDKAEADVQRLDLLDKDGETVVQVLIGQTDKGGGSYVRKVGDEQSWLVSEQISMATKAADWLDKNLIQIKPERIQRVDVRPVEGLGFALIKSDPQQKEFQLEQQVPEGKRIKPGQPRRLAAALNRVTLDDVLVVDEQLIDSDTKWHAANFKTFDGLRIEVKLREVDDKHYLKLLAQLEPEAKQQGPKEPAKEANNESDTTATEGVLKTHEEVAQDVEQLQQRFQSRTFIVSSYTANALGLTYEEMLEDLEEKDPDENE